MSSSANKKKVVIIGAGVAGLSAAKGFKSHQDKFEIQILEARNRIGGRVHTLRTHSGDMVELGANWLHRFDSTHPLYKSVNLLPDKELLFEINLMDLLSLKGLGKIRQHAPEILRANVLSLPRLIYDYLFSNRLNLHNFACLYESGLSRLPSLKALMKSLYASYLPADFNHNPLDNAHKIDKATCHLTATTQDEYFLGSGMDRIFSDLHSRNIEYEAIVKEIRFKGARFQIHYHHNDVQKRMEADYIVNTLPLGVLKEKFVKFDPEISFEKQKAISTLGMINVRKITLTFKAGIFAHIARQKKQLIHQRYFYFLDQLKKECFWIINLNGIKNAVHHTHAVLASTFIIYITGEEYEKYSTVSTSDLIQHLVNLLKIPFPEFEKEDLQEVHDHDWKKDKFSCGAYSYITTSGSMDDRAALNVPEYNGQMVFAGEHVVCGNMRGLAAACQSGICAVEKILQHHS